MQRSHQRTCAFHRCAADATALARDKALIRHIEAAGLGHGFANHASVHRRSRLFLEQAAGRLASRLCQMPDRRASRLPGLGRLDFRSKASTGCPLRTAKAETKKSRMRRRRLRIIRVVSRPAYLAVTIVQGRDARRATARSARMSVLDARPRSTAPLRRKDGRQARARRPNLTYPRRYTAVLLARQRTTTAQAVRKAKKNAHAAGVLRQLRGRLCPLRVRPRTLVYIIV
jgi:hypothetical protein